MGRPVFLGRDPRFWVDPGSTSNPIFYSYYVGVNDKNRLFTTWIEKTWVFLMSATWENLF